MISADSGHARPAPLPPPIKTYTLTVKVTGGPGTVTSSIPGLRCSAGACGATFPAGTRVTLTTSGGTLRDWSGACSGRGTYIVTMTKARSVMAGTSIGSPYASDRWRLAADSVRLAVCPEDHDTLFDTALRHRPFVGTRAVGGRAGAAGCGPARGLSPRVRVGRKSADGDQTKIGGRRRG
jgi:hypothetical protein